MPARLRRRPALIGAVLLSVSVACASDTADTTPRASIAVSPARPTAEAGAPIDLDYQLSAAAGRPAPAGDYWVFVHMLDESGSLLWTDDHAPPASWGAAPVTYRRAMFVPRIPYTGRVRIHAGLYARETGERLILTGTDRGGRAYEVATFDVRPPSNVTFISFGEGWHGAERDAGEAAREWRWSTGNAGLSFRRPPRDAELWIEIDQPVASVGAQTMEVRAGAELLATLQVAPGVRRIERVALPVARLGAAPTVDLELRVQPTFVPARTPGVANQDTRELGVRLFNAYVGP